MVIAEGMKTLVHDIVSSHEDRATALQEVEAEAKRVREEAENLIKDFRTFRKQSGVQLKKDLAQGKVRRKSEVNNMLGETKELLKGFQGSRKKASAQMHKELVEGIATLKSEVGQMRKELNQSQANNKAGVGRLRKEAQELVTDLGKTRQETGDKLRQDLTQGRADRESEMKEMRGDFAKAQAEVRADINEAAGAWQELGRTTRVKKSPPAVEIPDLETKLLTAINEHHYGITLAEVAGSLGVVPIVLGRAARALLDKGKVRKEDRLYFPLAG